MHAFALLEYSTLVLVANIAGIPQGFLKVCD